MAERQSDGTATSGSRCENGGGAMKSRKTPATRGLVAVVHPRRVRCRWVVIRPCLLQLRELAPETLGHQIRLWGEEEKLLQPQSRQDGPPESRPQNP